MSYSASFAPIVIDCVCPGYLGGACNLDSIDINYEIRIDGAVTATLWGIDLPVCGHTSTHGVGIGTQSLSSDCANTGGTLSFYFGRSLSSDDYGLSQGGWNVVGNYTCIVGEAATTTKQGGGFTGSVQRCLCEGATGGDVSSSLYTTGFMGEIIRTRPLGCTDCLVTIGTVLMMPAARSVTAPGGEQCFCATGGTTQIIDGVEYAPVLHYTITAGRLSGSQTLDLETGCIMGEPDPDNPASDIITVRATDMLSGEFGEVDCGFMIPGCIPDNVNIPRNRFR